MPPKRTSRKSAPARQQTRSFLARENEDDWGHGEDHDDGGGDSAAANDAGSGDLREMEESLKRSMAFDVSCCYPLWLCEHGDIHR